MVSLVDKRLLAVCLYWVELVLVLVDSLRLYCTSKHNNVYSTYITFLWAIKNPPKWV